MARTGEGVADTGGMTGAAPDRVPGATQWLSRDAIARRLGTPSGRPAATAILWRPSRPITAWPASRP
jgi:hypothetical protein